VSEDEVRKKLIQNVNTVHILTLMVPLRMDQFMICRH